jgi:hypothetical protein
LFRKRAGGGQAVSTSGQTLSKSERYLNWRYNARMPFIVEATGPDGQVRWLTAPKLHGLRTFGLRPVAEVFDTKAAAVLAIREMIKEEDCTGIVMSAEVADE